MKSLFIHKKIHIKMYDTFYLFMDDILDVITSRRSVKYFEPKFVSWEKIARVLDAGRHAPSCGNLQNWKFIVVLDPDLKMTIAEACHDQIEIMAAFTFIVVCGEPEKAERYYGLRGERLYTVQNCAAAVQNMLLEAHSLGLGSRWIGAFDEDVVREALKIPDDVRPQAIIPLGHAKDQPEKPPKYPLEVLTYIDSWRSKMRDPAKYGNDIAVIMARKAKKAKKAATKKVEVVVDKAKDVLKDKLPSLYEQKEE